jgi:UDP-N-acetylglucosamine--N-acetylmuramyl-(pentapeptide) pyrophosphoryl-undecaprenol N-acetylglucosamine transferase
MRVAFLAYGTGGHVVPAINVANALVERGLERESIAFVGSPREVERSLVAGAGFVHLGDWRRHFLASRGRTAMAAAALPLEALYWRRAFSRAGLACAVCFGGAGSVAPALGARLAGRPVLTVSLDAVLGRANKLVSRVSWAVVHAFRDACRRGDFFLGAPVRAEIEQVPSARRLPGTVEAARRRYSVPPGSPVVGVMGGSLGAAYLGEVARRVAETLEQVNVVWLVGAERAREVGGANEAGRPLPPNLVRKDFEEHMEHFYLACDLVVSRAGAMSVAELAASGTPAVLVPLPSAPSQHQRANAAAAERAGLAVVVHQELGPEAVVAAVSRLLANPSQLEAMSVSGTRLHPAGALCRYADLVLGLMEDSRRAC